MREWRMSLSVISVPQHVHVKVSKIVMRNVKVKEADRCDESEYVYNRQIAVDMRVFEIKKRRDKAVHMRQW